MRTGDSFNQFLRRQLEEHVDLVSGLADHLQAAVGKLLGYKDSGHGSARSREELAETTDAFDEIIVRKRIREP